LAPNNSMTMNRIRSSSGPPNPNIFSSASMNSKCE
jgi:hypothetical protein